MLTGKLVRFLLVHICHLALFSQVVIFVLNFSSRGSHILIPDRVTLRDVWVELNATIIGMDEITVENGGRLYVWSYARTHGKPVGEIHCTNISVRAGGKFEPLTAEHQMKLVVIRIVINGNGYMRTNSLHLKAVNVTVDLSGNTHICITLVNLNIEKP